MPRKNDFKRKRKLEKKKRKKELKKKKRKSSQIKRSKIENIKGQVIESANPTFNKSAFSENVNDPVKQLDVFKKPMTKVFDKSAWKNNDGQE
jgi:hypothetical protein